MTVRAVPGEIKVEHRAEKGQVAGSTRYDWAIIALGTWLMIGGYSDGWAHNHLSIDNFFTPWHSAFYSGFLASIIFLTGTFIRNRRRGYSARLAMPAGYELSLLGSIIILFGGVGDMFWHMLFGIELNIDGALSPTHIAITIGLALVVSGPFRAAWQRANDSSQLTLVSLLPMLLSLTFTLSTITIIMQIFHPFVFAWASDPTGSNQGLGVASIVMQTGILMGFVLLTVRRWMLPFGSLTLVFTLNMIFLSFMQDHYLLILVAALAGLTADLLIRQLKPSTTKQLEIHIFGFIVPVVLYLLYFLALKLTSGVYWTIHLWLGSTVVAGIAGWLLSYILVPPQIPAEKQVEKRNTE
jgi:hypothetical protein